MGYTCGSTRKEASLTDRGLLSSLYLLAVALLVASASAHALETVTLAPRSFAAGSPAARFSEVFPSLRGYAVDTTSAWLGSNDDLPAWGPAIIFPLLQSSASTDTLLGLAAPLEGEAPAPRLLFRTLGLYAAKSRLAFDETPSLQHAVERNLEILNKTVGTPASFTASPELATWGDAGIIAWVAYLNLLYRDYWDLDAPAGNPWNAEGLELVERLLTQWRRDGGGFRARPGTDGLELYPNALATLALEKAYENEELVRFESAAIDTAGALEALRDGDGGSFSSAARQDKDARANAYYASALLQLHKNTGDAVYRNRAADILAWLTKGTGAAQVGRDGGLAAHVAHAIVLLDSVSTARQENVLGRRAMRSGEQRTAVSTAAIVPTNSPYRSLVAGLLTTLSQQLPRQHGDFAYDYGDSPGYATETLLATGDTAAALEIVQREQHIVRGLHPHDFSEASFGVDALFAARDLREADPNTVDATLQRYMVASGLLARLDRYYFDWLDWLTGGGGFGYGPTVFNAQVAMAQMRYAAVSKARDGRLLRPRSTAFNLIRAARKQAWDASASAYRSRGDDAEIWLLPNAMMILTLLQGRALFDEPRFVTRAEAVVRGLEPLWDAARGAYFASTSQTGAQGYQSLSTNSYAALALWRLGRATGKPEYTERARRILAFFARDLYADGILYHHIYRGHRTAGDIWCPGCNWRAVSVFREVEGE